MFECRYCGKDYPKAGNYLRHLITKHGMTIETVREEFSPEDQEKFRL